MCRVPRGVRPPVERARTPARKWAGALHKTTDRSRLQTVDALRGFAALAVCLFHFTGAGLPKLKMPLTEAAFGWGYLGVEVFFVISGFIIPHMLMRSRYSPRDAGLFLLKRFLRLAPPAWLAIGLTLLQAMVIDVAFGRHWLAGFSAPQLLANLAFAVPFTPYQWIDGVLWTLAIELQFYIFLALAFPVCFSNRRNFALYAALAALVSLSPVADTALGLAQYAPLFALGGASLMHRTDKINTVEFLALAAALGLATAIGVGWPEAAFGVATALAISFGSITNRPALFLGRISYSLYLTHMLAGPAVEGLAAKVVPLTSPVTQTIVLVASLAAAILTAWAFNIAVEQPAIWLARRINRREVNDLATSPS
jgi:peptidoglycan/LPS O-acetylase OafA/YrhL